MQINDLKKDILLARHGRLAPLLYRLKRLEQALSSKPETDEEAIVRMGGVPTEELEDVGEPFPPR